MIVLSFVCCIPLPRPRRRGVTATSSHTSVRIKNGNKYLSPEKAKGTALGKVYLVNLENINKNHHIFVMKLPDTSS